MRTEEPFYSYMCRKCSDDPGLKDGFGRETDGSRSIIHSLSYDARTSSAPVKARTVSDIVVGVSDREDSPQRYLCMRPVDLDTIHRLRAANSGTRHLPKSLIRSWRGKISQFIQPYQIFDGGVD